MNEGSRPDLFVHAAFFQSCWQTVISLNTIIYISLGHPRAPAPSMLYPASDIDWRFDSYLIVYMFQCHSPKSSHPLPLPLSPKVHSLLLSRIQGHHYHLSKFHIYVLVYYISVFLSALLHSV